MRLPSGRPRGLRACVVLERAAVLMEERIDEFVRSMQIEAGFTQADASGEVRRCIQTLKLPPRKKRAASPAT